jgi:hypothetical protein
MNETPLESAQRELQELYRRLALTRLMSRERIVVQMQIARTRRRIRQLEQKHSPSQPPTS